MDGMRLQRARPSLVDDTAPFPDIVGDFEGAQVGVLVGFRVGDSVCVETIGAVDCAVVELADGLAVGLVETADVGVSTVGDDVVWLIADGTEDGLAVGETLGM